MEGSVEERILQLQEMKLGLVNEVLTGAKSVEKDLCPGSEEPSQYDQFLGHHGLGYHGTRSD